MERVWYQNDGLCIPVVSYAWHEGNLSETGFSVRIQASQRGNLSVCGVLRFYSQFCVVSTRRLSEGIMTDLRTASREFLTKFIHMYHEYPCLWKVKSKECSNRVKKNLAYEHLTTKLKATDPDANKEKVVKKINSLRSCFRKELKKVNDSKTCGAGADDTYTPSLWYFLELLFLTDQKVPRKDISNLEPPDDTNHGEVRNNL